MTSWVRPGVVCECVDQEWHDFFSDEEVTGPLIGDRYTISSHTVADGVVFVQFVGEDMCYEARAFRPVVDLADDVALFRHHLKGSSASLVSSESACSL
jgi:hypothetical protein